MIIDKVKELIAEQLSVDPEKITEDTRFINDLEADSLDIVELTMAIEEEFDLPEIPEEELANLVSVRDLVDYISSKID